MTKEEQIALIVVLALKYYDKYQEMVNTGTLGTEFTYTKLTDYYDARKDLLKAVKELKDV